MTINNRKSISDSEYNCLSRFFTHQNIIYSNLFQFPFVMVLISDGNSENARMKAKNCSRSNQMPLTDRITAIAPDVRIYV